MTKTPTAEWLLSQIYEHGKEIHWIKRNNDLMYGIKLDSLRCAIDVFEGMTGDGADAECYKELDRVKDYNYYQGYTKALLWVLDTALKVGKKEEAKMAKRKVADIVRVDGSTERLPTTVAKMGLENVQTIVGGYIKHVPLTGFGELWCNEEGKLRGLPTNHKASQIACQHIFGDVIIESWELNIGKGI